MTKIQKNRLHKIEFFYLLSLIFYKFIDLLTEGFFFYKKKNMIYYDLLYFLNKN